MKKTFAFPPEGEDDLDIKISDSKINLGTHARTADRQAPGLPAADQTQQITTAAKTVPVKTEAQLEVEKLNHMNEMPLNVASGSGEGGAEDCEIYGGDYPEMDIEN